MDHNRQPSAPIPGHTCKKWVIEKEKIVFKLKSHFELPLCPKYCLNMQWSKHLHKYRIELNSASKRYTVLVIVRFCWWHFCMKYKSVKHSIWKKEIACNNFINQQLWIINIMTNSPPRTQDTVKCSWYSWGKDVDVSVFLQLYLIDALHVYRCKLSFTLNRLFSVY